MLNMQKYYSSSDKVRFYFVGALFLVSIVYGADKTSNTIAWSVMIMTLFGGLALFLYGMNKMSDGMKKAAGDRLRNVLSAITKTRILGVLVGAFVTMVIQSSSATTVMLVSFVQAQLMTFVQSIGVILGANIGTTVTAQLIAFKLTNYALAMIAIGFILTFFSKKDSTKYFGEALLGFGLLFFGMKLMSDAMKPLRTFEPFINLMQELENPLFGLLMGAGFTALIQSSSAFTGIVIVLAQQGLLTIDAGIPMILGANIGTCVTAGLASIGATREAKRVALAHIIFNSMGVLIFIWFASYLADLVVKISPSSNAVGMAKLAADTPRQIANAHTIFNVGVALIFIPFTPILAKLILKILPEKKVERGVIPAVWHLDDSVITSPTVALSLAQTEITRMAKIIKRMLSAVIRPIIYDIEEQDEIYPQLTLREGIDMREEKIDFLEENITDYLFKITREELTDSQSTETYTLMSIVKDMENIGDVIHRNLLPLIDKKLLIKEDFTKKGKKEIEDYHTIVMKQVSRFRDALSEMDFKKAKKVLKKDSKYEGLDEEYRRSHIERVHKEKTKSVATHEIHMDLIDMLKQINVYLNNMAKTLMTLKKKKSKKK